MAAISVGSVEVDVVPNTRNIYSRLRASVVPAADSVGDEIGRLIGRHVSTRISQAVRDGVTQGGRTAVAPAARQGQATGSAFARSFKGRVEAALRDLPDVQIDADSSAADREIAAIRAQLQSLRDTTVGVDIDAGEAQARIARIQAQLQRLQASDADVNVRMDVGAASAQLAAFQAELNRIDGRDVNVRVDPVIRSFGMLTTAAAAFGPAIIPALPVVAAGLGAVAAMAVSAGVGLGAVGLAAAPAFKDIAGALQAQKAAQDAAATAAIKGGQANGQGASKALQLAGAQQSLATAHRNASRQIGQAEQAVADAVRSSAEANRQAGQQVKAARQSLADAVQQAADRQRDAAERVAQAEDSLAEAQRTARQAQQDLTQARKDAALELAELSNRLADAQLGERDAVLSVQEARDRLRATQAVGSKATVLEQQRAQLSYDQAVQRLKEQREETQQLAGAKKAADKAGVEGSETVKSAQQRLAKADRGVAEQQQALGKARSDAALQQVQGQREIAQAQEKVAESQRNVTRVQEDGARSVARAQESLVATQQSAADSITSAQRQIASASQQAAGGIDQAAVAQAKYQAALAKLTPSARGTLNAFVDLRTAFGDWSRSLQPQVMPIFTRSLNGLRNALPALTPFVKAAASAIGDLQDRASRGFKSPWWKTFKTDLAGSVKPAIIGLGVAFANVFKGIAGLIGAFLPHMDSISTRLQEITGRFAAWGQGLRGSPEFERFLSYSNEQAPLLAETLGNLMGALLRLGVALAPLAVTAQMFLNVLAGIIEAVPIDVLTVLGVAFASLAIGAKLAALAVGIWKAAQVAATIATAVMTGQTLALNAAMRANLIGAIITLIAALVVSLVYAYQHSEKFRAIVQGAWRGIQVAASFAWNSVLKPIFDGLVVAIQWAGRTSTWLWRNAIKPAFDGIALAAKILITIIAVILIAPLVVAFKLAAATGKWLWQKILGPAFRGIGAGAKWLYDSAIKPSIDKIAAAARWLGNTIIKPFARGFVGSLQIVGKIGRWLYNTALKPAFQGIAGAAKDLWSKGIKPVFNWIGDKATWLYNKGLKPAFDRIRKAVALVGYAFGKAKDAIGYAFGKIKSLTKDPVNFVIKWVYTKGIKAVWDKVAKYVGLGELPDAPKLLARGGTVGDGFGPARPMVTSRPTAIVGEGNPRYPEFVIPTDPRYRGRAQALHAAAGTKLMASGGVLGPLGGAWDWTKDTVGDVVGKGVDWAKAGADLITNPTKVWAKLTKPILGKVAKGVGSAPLGDAIGKFPQKMATGLKDKIVDAVSSMFAGGGGGGEWLKPVTAKYGTKFGVAGSMWSSGHHTGLDFPAATGTAIRAVNDGTVSQVASGGPYGKHVQIDHGGGLSSFYAHMSSAITKLHKHVARGTRIGKVGATGNTTGPHLHLEARRNGRPVDPMPFLTGGGGGGFSANAVGAAQRYAKSILGRYGWGAGQFGPLKKLWTNESNWRWNALNRSSGAYGIPQSLPASKMASEGADYRTNAKTQVRWGMGYIKDRPDYGSPAAAWSKWQSRSPHWYDSGGMLQPGLNLAYNGTGRPEPVLTGSQWDLLGAAIGGPGVGDLHVSVFVGDREITDIARTEVRTAQGELLVGLGAA